VVVPVGWPGWPGWPGWLPAWRGEGASKQVALGPLLEGVMRVVVRGGAVSQPASQPAQPAQPDRSAVDRIRDPVHTAYAPARDCEGSAVVKGRVN